MDAPCQRWRQRRDSYRPAGEPIDPDRYGVEVIGESAAREFVVGHHYSGSYPAARCRVGLFEAGRSKPPQLVGVAVFSVPAGPRVISRWLPHLEHHMEGIELGRFVLLDHVPANGESWFLARAFRALHQQLPAVRAVVSFSDPVRRRALDGRVVTPGHVGTIYQALGGLHLGRSTPRTLTLAPDGTVFSERAKSKIRRGERGQRYACEQLRELGAPRRWRGESGAAYLRRALAGPGFRKARHPGNFVYTWAIGSRRERRNYKKVAPDALPYPKAPGAIVVPGEQRRLL